MGTSITINIVPKCEVCPRDHGKVVESLRGLNICDSNHSPYRPLGKKSIMSNAQNANLSRNRQMYELWMLIQDSIGPAYLWPIDIRRLIWIGN